MVLEELRKQSKMKKDEEKKSKRDEKEEEKEPDIEGLLGKLNDQIRSTFRVIDANKLLKGKETLDLLQDIEIVLMEFRKVINVIYNEPGECKLIVEKQEVDRRNERLEMTRINGIAEELLKNKQKKELAIQKDLNRRVIFGRRQGKNDRSEKPEV